MRHPDQFVRTLTEKLMTYGLGRGLEYYDMPIVRAVARDAAKKNYRFSAIVAGIVSSPPFRQKAPQAGGAALSRRRLALRERRCSSLESTCRGEPS